MLYLICSACRLTIYEANMNRIIWIVGLVVIVLVIAGWLGLR